jgi:hypothetical protein
VHVPYFYIQGVGVTRKVSWSITIVNLIGLYLQCFLSKRFDLIRVGLYLCELFHRYLAVMWAYADPHMGLLSHLGHVPWVRILGNLVSLF